VGKSSAIILRVFFFPLSVLLVSSIVRAAGVDRNANASFASDFDICSAILFSDFAISSDTLFRIAFSTSEEGAEPGLIC